MKQSQIDYAALQIGRIHEQLEQFKEMEGVVGWISEKYGLKGDYTQAIYRKGFAQQAQGKSREAIDTYWQAIEKYGNDPKAMGIDIIIDAYCEEGRSVQGLQPLEIIRSAALTAEQQNNAPALFAFSVRSRNLIQSNSTCAEREGRSAGQPSRLALDGGSPRKDQPDARRARYPRFYRQFRSDPMDRGGLFQTR